ncbi:ABC transporter substrate-binding protein [Arenibaculum pallidiluteum]|uniref:ABC transporter substrate-binding protein n=1 Tax=Arenibaculum pallidiluteum TaxID=2812559 RepID=UPI001A95B710|nr:ABC transporter substrate-binding protein [Arenibaculum pallidiluteum]
MLRAALAALVLYLPSTLSPAAAAAGDEVVDIVAPFEIVDVDPSITGDLFLRMNVAETLVGTDLDGRPAPALASDWTLSADARVWRFRLRQGVTFHDGSPLTAEAAVGALRHAMGKPGILGRAPITEIAADGDGVLVRLSEPFSPLPAFLAQYTTVILAPASYDAGGRVQRVLGTGPYRVASLQAPQRLEVERFDGYWGERPAIRAAAYLAVGRSETRALMAESGDADFVFNLDPASRIRLGRSPKLSVQSVPIPRTILLKVNAGDDLLRDPRVRQALSLAIDREGIAATILRFPAAATQLFPPSVAAWHHPGLAPLGHDAGKARALLAEAGWAAGADGILAKDGRRFSLTLVTYPDRPELPLVAAVLQEQFREVGIEVAVNSTSSSEIPARHQDGTLQMGLAARNFALVPDPIGTVLQDYPPRGGDWGSMNWSDPDFHKAISDLIALSDDAQARPLREKAVAILQAELPVIPIAWYQQTAAVSRRLLNVRLDPFERDFGLAGMRWAP